MQALAPQASSPILIGIAGLSLWLLAAWTFLLWRAARGQPVGRFIAVRFSRVLLLWAGGWLLLALHGTLARTDLRPPPSAWIPPALFIALALLLRTREARLLSEHAPLWMLVGLQTFRLPLELVMHQAALEGVMPAQMTWGSVGGVTGLNYDMVTGATALPLALWLLKGDVPRAVVLAWNALGSLLVLAVLAVGVASTPMFAAFGSAPDRLNTWVLFAPFVWVPTVLVGSALFGHALIFRRLWR